MRIAFLSMQATTILPNLGLLTQQSLSFSELLGLTPRQQKHVLPILPTAHLFTQRETTAVNDNESLPCRYLLAQMTSIDVSLFGSSAPFATEKGTGDTIVGFFVERFSCFWTTSGIRHNHLLRDDRAAKFNTWCRIRHVQSFSFFFSLFSLNLNNSLTHSHAALDSFIVPHKQ